MLLKLNKQYQNEGVELSLLQDDLEIEVYGDKEKLKQVIVNLISNSLKYTNEGSVEIIVGSKIKVCHYYCKRHRNWY